MHLDVFVLSIGGLVVGVVWAIFGEVRFAFLVGIEAAFAVSVGDPEEVGELVDFIQLLP